MSSRLDNRQRFGRTVRAIIDKAPIKASRLASGLRKALAEYEETVRYRQRLGKGPAPRLVKGLRAGSREGPPRRIGGALSRSKQED